MRKVTKCAWKSKTSTPCNQRGRKWWHGQRGSLVIPSGPYPGPGSLGWLWLEVFIWVSDGERSTPRNQHLFSFGAISKLCQIAKKIMYRALQKCQKIQNVRFLLVQETRINRAKKWFNQLWTMVFSPMQRPVFNVRLLKYRGCEYITHRSFPRILDVVRPDLVADLARQAGLAAGLLFNTGGKIGVWL